MMRLKSSQGRGEKAALFDGQEHVTCLKSSGGVASAAKSALFDGTDFNDRLRVAGRGEKSAVFHGEEHMKDSHRVRGAAKKLTLFHGLHERAKRKARGGHPSFKMSRSTAARKLPLSTF